MEESLQTPASSFKIIGNWDYITECLRQRFPLLTDEDLLFEPGKENELIGRLQETLNRQPAEIMNLINRHQLKFFVPGTM